MRVRVSGEGEPGFFGGAPGDFYVKMTITPEPTYGRVGSDLYVYAKVERSRAINGGEIPVIMPDGSTLIVNGPKGLKDGVMIRVRDSGMPIPHKEHRGALYVTVKIVPDSIKGVPVKQAAVSPTPERTQQPVPHLPIPSTTPHMRIDTLIGNYRILSILGSGGFAEVFLAEHIYLKTRVAIKILRDRVNRQAGQEFLREAQTIATLKHPHIVRILDFGIEDSTTTPFLVMDYVANGTIQECYEEGTLLSLPTVISYVKQVASALDFAHSQKVIHRDVKPANMLVEANHILLSDFGIAVGVHTTKSLVTQDAIGTVTYMAPEQIHKKARPASDQYALAVVAYEWLCGEPPFTGDPIEIAMSHISDPPPSLCARVSMLPPSVEQVVFKALSKDPDQRFATVQDFAEALNQIV